MHGYPSTPGALVAVVGGSGIQKHQITNALASLYRLTYFSDSEAAMTGLRQDPPAVVLVDELAAPAGGYEFVRRIRQSEDTRQLPTVICTVAKSRQSVLAAVNQCGANAHLAQPYRRSSVVRTVSTLINAETESHWEELPELQRSALKKTIAVFHQIPDAIDRGEPISFAGVRDACVPLIDAVKQNDFQNILEGVRGHDNYSYVHSLRVAALLSLLGHAMGLEQADLLLLASGGLLHDVGKMAIPVEILNKPGRFTPEEWRIMQGHVAASVHFLKASDNIPKPVFTMAGQHHEKIDGSGYPAGLAGSQLNELTRMVTIVDVFSALTDLRPYKSALDGEKALAIMTDEMTSQIDIGLLALFRSVLLDAALTI
ncbi:MAG: HD domain-containing protein [Azospirillum sp.]|nr:HD domain-containing protein [Azospirillum sp.]